MIHCYQSEVRGPIGLHLRPLRLLDFELRATQLNLPPASVSFHLVGRARRMTQSGNIAPFTLQPNRARQTSQMTNSVYSSLRAKNHGK
jgi:hypothetical protein